MIVKPWHAGVLGKIVPYRPRSSLSLKDPSFGIAIAAGFIQLSFLAVSATCVSFPSVVGALVITDHAWPATATWVRLARRRESGISITNSTIITTAIITTTVGSLKFWPATTNAAAVLRCAVPRASTPFVPVLGPPRAH